MPQPAPGLARLIDDIREAAATATAVNIVGSGSKEFYGEAVSGRPLDVNSLAGITSYEPTELVVTARAGTPLLDLEAALAEQGQCLPFEPPRYGTGGTVGGMVAAGLSGPARPSVGSMRDHVLGLTLLNGRGELLTFGGQVAKNVAGYDVSRLITGSLGILGVICEVSLKVLPTPRATATLCFDWEQAHALAKLRQWNSRPLPLTASAWLDDRLYVRLGGAEAAVHEARAELAGASLAPEAADAWWRGVRDQSCEFFTLSDAALAAGEVLWRLSLPANTPALQLDGRQLIEWGGAQRWLRTAGSVRNVRSAAIDADGHATLLRAADKAGGVFTPLSDVLMRIHRALKQAFDPAGIFNPGRLYADL